MDATFNVSAIILKRDDWKENDRLITAYSAERGKLKLIARGAKKIKSKTAGHIEPLILSRLMVVRGKNDFDYVGTASGEEFYAKIKSDYQKTALAVRALNLTEKMTREGEVGGQAEIFNLLKNFLDELNTPPSNRISPLPACPPWAEGGLRGVGVGSGFEKYPLKTDKSSLEGGVPPLAKGGTEGVLPRGGQDMFPQFSQKLAAILGFSREDFEELIRR